MTRQNEFHPGLSAIYAKQDEEGNALDPHFSKSPCDCCGDRLAGNRYNCLAVIRLLSGRLDHTDGNGTPLTLEACPSCVEAWQ
jgi:hypothetical protein